MAFFTHNLLVLSDLHLGSDLVHHAQPDAPRRARASQRRNRDLVGFLDHYREHPQGGRPWRLVIAGDFMDFAGMSVMPDVSYETAPTSEELAHGLGGAPDHTLAKLELLMEHEQSVMASLARFVAAGNSLVVVRGNHDVDWHWEPVQEAFRKKLLAHATFPEHQLEFAPWFYYEEGLVFIEHGHQYDPYCSFEHVLHPVSPFDPRRTMRSLSDVLLRYVVRPTRGMTEAGHAAAGILTYLRFAFGLGARGMLLLAKRFVAATRALIDLWQEHVSDATEWVRGEQERKLAVLGRLHRIQLDRLRGLLRLQRPPITKSLLALLASVMLDRVLLGALGVVAVLVVLLSVESTAIALSIVAAVVASLVGLGAAWRRLRDTLEPSAELRERSALVARLFPAAFIVMGHTHLPEKQPTTEHATYVNLGAWAEDEVEDGLVPNLPATRTHLLVTRVEDRPVAELLAWHPNGPLPYGNESTKGRPKES
ncbi:MAG TPA: metallophosphoesterase [Polyangiaceae bacterium]|nr:metallophosphoesterase [Polyangiaceae bacterium]